MESSNLKYFKGFFTPFFDIINTEFNDFSKEKISRKSPHYKSVLRAAFTKCFEFNYFISRPKELKNPFFLLGTLRSICEDLISLSYLKSLKAKDREELISFNLEFDIIKNLIVQERFFNKYNSGQIVVRPDQFADEDYCHFVDNKPINKKQAAAKGYKLYPSVFQMAKEAGYIDLYTYLYYATSSLVHFRADVLLKLGWNKDLEDKKQNIFRYSVSNYSEYYSEFNLVYGGLMFCEFVLKFNKDINLSKHLLSETKYFKDSFDLFDWPEIMTHDHMNFRQPSDLKKQLRRSYFVVNNLLKKNRR